MQRKLDFDDYDGGYENFDNKGRDDDLVMKIMELIMIII
jgi:hypothetical protein